MRSENLRMRFLLKFIYGVNLAKVILYICINELRDIYKQNRNLESS